MFIYNCVYNQRWNTSLMCLRVIVFLLVVVSTAAQPPVPPPPRVAEPIVYDTNSMMYGAVLFAMLCIFLGVAFAACTAPPFFFDSNAPYQGYQKPIDVRIVATDRVGHFNPTAIERAAHY